MVVQVDESFATVNFCNRGVPARARRFDRCKRAARDMVQTRRARGAVTDAGARPSLARDAHTLSPLVAAFLDTRSVADFIGALQRR